MMRRQRFHSHGQSNCQATAMASFVPSDTDPKKKKTVLDRYVAQYNYLDKLTLSWKEIDEHEAHDSSDLIRPKETMSTAVADREDAFSRVKKTKIPVPDEHHYKKNVISMLQTVDQVYVEKRRYALVHGSDNTGDDEPDENAFITRDQDASRKLHYFQIKAVKDAYSKYETRKAMLDGHANNKHSTLNCLANIHVFFIKQMDYFPLRVKNYYLRNLAQTIADISDKMEQGNQQNLWPHHYLKKNKLHSALEGFLIDIESSGHTYKKMYRGKAFYDINWYQSILGKVDASSSYDIRYEGAKLGNASTKMQASTRLDQKHYQCLVKAFRKHMKEVSPTGSPSQSHYLPAKMWVINDKSEFFACINKYREYSSALLTESSNESIDGTINSNFKSLNQINFILGDKLHPLERDILEMEYLHITEKEKLFIMSPSHLENILISMSRYTDLLTRLRISTFAIESEPTVEFHAKQHAFFKPGTYEADALYIHEAEALTKEIMDMA